ncbi:putative ATP-dependent RNA helicase SoYb [Drosophila grimshawi]|uniref:RNA helicase n=1 Tax=Drosophila grimshawi TaxID=7222 RepID=B4JL32_DROGR|nr:putative ATP-dependent RNA helicase SoYb [Drosophila grimshawi]XP_043072139.1 putative ATP-dependent RNA helicase SoYb [Drosophila grimshawi]EDW00285.1 GH12780 [Drosophila grimshawi]
MHQPEQQLLSEQKDEDANVKITTHHLDGVTYKYVTPTSVDAGLDFLAASIKTKDFNTVRIAIACEQSDEAAHLMQQLGKRSVASLLVNESNITTIGTCVGLWTSGLINPVLIVYDNVLQPLAELGKINCVNYLIHSSQTLPHVFQKRIQALTSFPGNNTLVLVMMCSIANQTTKNPTRAVPSEVATKATLCPMPTGNPLPDLGQIAKIKPTVVNDIKETRKLVTSEQLETGADNVHTYNNNGLLACSRKEQSLCRKIDDVVAIEPHIRNAMKKLSIEHAKNIQRYAWSHTAAGRSLCVIGNEMIGKTWCYLPSLCQRVYKEAFRLNTDDSSNFAPSSIIICANAKQGEQIHQWCMKLLDCCVIKLFDRSNLSMVDARLRSPSDILITNVEVLLQLINLKSILNPLALRCVAFDNFDLIWRSSRMDCEKVMLWLLDLLRFEAGHAQLFIVGRLWSDKLMRRLLSRLPDLLLLFEDALEATAYSGIKLELLLTSPKHIEQDMLKLLQAKNLKEERVVLVCSGKADALTLHKQLLASNIDTLAVAQLGSGAELLLSKWSKERTASVLLVVDDVLRLLCDVKVDCLLHFKFPSFWQRFKARYTIFYGNNHSQPNSGNATSTIPVCLQDVEQIWLICDFMFKHERLPPDFWLSMLTSSRKQLEDRTPRLKQAACHQLLRYGNCYRHTCQYRHFLWDNEPRPLEDYPKKSLISFHLLMSFSPSQLSVRSTKFKVTKYFLNIPVTELGERIQLHYEQSKNQRRHLDPKPGDLCVVKHNKLYQRVVVLEVGDLNRVTIKQLDAGSDLVLIGKSDLLECEEQFTNTAWEANDLRITGLTPFNLERLWSEEAKRLVRNQFFYRQLGKPCRVFTAIVDFGFNSTIFVDNVYDEKGNDLKSFVLQHILSYMDEHVEMRLKELINTCKPFPESAKEPSDEEEEQHSTYSTAN